MKKGEKEEDQGIQQIIDKMFTSLGLKKRIKELDVVSAWPELMGTGVANRTERIYIKNNVLHLKMNSSVMRDELQYGRSIIIDRVNKYAGFNIIRDVWFE